MFQRLQGIRDALVDAHRDSASCFRSESCSSISSMGTVRRHRMVSFCSISLVLRRSSMFPARTGPTTCVAGYDCIVSNACKNRLPSHIVETHAFALLDHSQCLPAAPPPTPGTQIRAVEDPVFHFYLQNIGTYLSCNLRGILI